MEENDIKTVAQKKSRIPFVLFVLSLIFITLAAWIYFREDEDNTGYKGKPWYEDYIPDAVELALDQKTVAPSVYPVLDVVYGNSAEFSGNGSIIAEDEKFFYLADPTKEGNIYSIAKSDRSRRLIVPVQASEIVLLDSRLYFVNPSDNAGYRAGLYSCFTDGSSLKFLLEGSIRSLEKKDKKLMFIRNSDLRLCCLDLSDKKESVVCDDECLCYAVSDNSIFYITKDHNREAGADKVICRISENEGSGYHLTEYGNYGDIGFIDGKLGFIVYDEGYGLIDPDSDVTISLSDLDKKLVKMKGLYSLPVESGGYLWYIDRSRDRQLIRKDLETKKEEQLEAFNVTSFYITKDSVLYAFMEDGVDYALASRLSEGWGVAALLEGELR